MIDVTNGYDDQPSLYPFRALLVTAEAVDPEGTPRKISIAHNRRTDRRTVFDTRRPVAAAVQSVVAFVVQDKYTDLKNIKVWGI